MDTTVKMRVEYSYDPESKNWCFRVPSLGIIGGAETREQAEHAVLEAIRFTLDDPAPVARGGDEVRYVTVAVTAAP